MFLFPQDQTFVFESFDDLEALGYTLLSITHGSRPWSRFKNIVGILTSRNNFVKEQTGPILYYFKALDQMRVTGRVDYDHLINILKCEVDNVGNQTPEKKIPKCSELIRDSKSKRFNKVCGRAVPCQYHQYPSSSRSRRRLF